MHKWKNQPACLCLLILLGGCVFENDRGVEGGPQYPDTSQNDNSAVKSPRYPDTSHAGYTRYSDSLIGDFAPVRAGNKWTYSFTDWEMFPGIVIRDDSGTYTVEVETSDSDSATLHIEKNYVRCIACDSNGKTADTTVRIRIADDTITTGVGGIGVMLPFYSRNTMAPDFLLLTTYDGHEVYERQFIQAGMSTYGSTSYVSNVGMIRDSYHNTVIPSSSTVNLIFFQRK